MAARVYSGKYNNIVADPQFVNSAAGDFHLTASSPAIDHGQNNALQLFQNLTGMQLTADLDGNARVQDATGNGCAIDMGAYEYPGSRSVCGFTETLTSSANPSALVQSVTFAVQLAGANGVPTGAVQFSDEATVAVSGAGAAAITLGAGQRGTVQVMLTSVGGFSGVLTLIAGAMPMYASGSISPGTVMLASGSGGWKPA